MLDIPMLAWKNPQGPARQNDRIDVIVFNVHREKYSPGVRLNALHSPNPLNLASKAIFHDGFMKYSTVCLDSLGTACARHCVHRDGGMHVSVHSDGLKAVCEKNV